MTEEQAAGNGPDDLNARAARLGREFAELAREGARRIYEEGGRLAGEGTEAVRRHPGIAIALATGLGLVVGLARRR